MSIDNPEVGRHSPVITTTTPDPSKATEARIERAVLALKDYIDGKFAVAAERLDAIDKAAEVLDRTIHRTPTEIQLAVGALSDVVNEKLIAEKEAGLKRDENVDKRLEDIYTLTDTKFVTLKTVIEANAAQVSLALDASERAITKSEIATDKRFESVNGFQKSLNDLSNLMATRREVETAINEIKNTQAEVNKQLGELRSRLDVGNPALAILQNQYAASQGVNRGSDITMGKIYAAIGALGIILGILTLVTTQPR